MRHAKGWLSLLLVVVWILVAAPPVMGKASLAANMWSWAGIHCSASRKVTSIGTPTQVTFYDGGLTWQYMS